MQSVSDHEARVRASSEEVSVRQRELNAERDRIANDTQRLNQWDKSLTAKEEVRKNRGGLLLFKAGFT